MYGEYPNGGTMEMKCCNVDFLEDEFRSIGEIKKDVELYESWQDIRPSLGEGHDLNSHQAIEDGTPCLSDRIEGGIFAWETKVRPRSQILKESQPKNEVQL